MNTRVLVLASTLVLALAEGGTVAAQSAPGEPSSGEPGRPGREVSLPASEVKDTFFAYFLGIIANEAAVDMNNEQMRDVLVEFKTTLDVPFDLISRVTQLPDPESGLQVIGLELTQAATIPVPFALLFYHPGSIRLSRYVSFDVHRLPWTDPVKGGPPGTAFDLVLSHGTIFVDIDDWLEALFRDHLEDTWLQRVVFFKWNGDWIAMLFGIGRYSGHARRAYFDLTTNRILFPAGDELNHSGQKFAPG